MPASEGAELAVEPTQGKRVGMGLVSISRSCLRTSPVGCRHIMSPCAPLCNPLLSSRVAIHSMQRLLSPAASPTGLQPSCGSAAHALGLWCRRPSLLSDQESWLTAPRRPTSSSPTDSVDRDGTQPRRPEAQSVGIALHAIISRFTSSTARRG